MKKLLFAPQKLMNLSVSYAYGIRLIV